LSFTSSKLVPVKLWLKIALCVTLLYEQPDGMPELHPPSVALSNFLRTLKTSTTYTPITASSIACKHSSAFALRRPEGQPLAARVQRRTSVLSTYGVSARIEGTLRAPLSWTAWVGTTEKKPRLIGPMQAAAPMQAAQPPRQCTKDA
jgi:hypothetical protein